MGADFRTARDAFQLVVTVKRLLDDWAQPHLHILINNAAQTLTDPVKSEVKAISRETRLSDAPSRYLPTNEEHQYEPRLRGGTQATWVAGIEARDVPLIEKTDEGLRAGQMTHKGLRDENDLTKSSWGQTLSEIPYEDVISAFSVNTFVPLILCRELLPLMGLMNQAAEQRPEQKPDLPSRPAGYIINVSSREGILENRSPKTSHHVHTNMTKAAVNMITETEAENAWRRKVAMNTVDPGYMSAAPESQHKGSCPIGFEDGAARVLWPISMGEQEDGIVVRGRFLKHFGQVSATIQRG